MNKKPPQLPNIEDATLRACLAPLMEAMHATVEPDPPAAPPRMPLASPFGPANSNDKPSPLAEAPPVAPRGVAVRPPPEWRSMAEDEVGVFRTAELFLAMTDAEREAVAAEFPRQIAGTVARIAATRRRLLEQYDMATTVIALLERASARTAAGDSGRAAPDVGARPSGGADDGLDPGGNQ